MGIQCASFCCEKMGEVFYAKKNRKNLCLLYAVSFLQGMVFYAPVAMLYRQAAHMTVTQTAVTESVCLAVSVFLEVPWGILADVIGYRRTLQICAAVSFLSKIVFWKAEGFAGFLTERILLGIVTAGLSGADVSFLYQSAPPETFQKNLGIYQNLSTAGLLTASAVCTVLTGKDYRLAALLTMGSYGLAMLCSFGLERAGEEQKQGRNSFRFRDSFSGWDWKWLIFLVVTAFGQEFHQMLTVYLGQLQYVRCGAGEWANGAVYILVTVAGLAGGFSAGLTRRLGAKRVTVLCFLLAAAGCGVLAGTENFLLSVGAVLLVQVCFRMFWPLQMSIQNKRAAPGNRATALSMNSLLMNLTACSVNPVFGKLADAGLPLVMTAGFLCCLAGAVLLPFFGDKKEKRAGKEESVVR